MEGEELMAGICVGVIIFFLISLATGLIIGKWLHDETPEGMEIPGVGFVEVKDEKLRS